LLRKGYEITSSKLKATQTGFLADQLQLVAPWAVTGYKDEVDSENRPVYQKADYKGLIPILTAAIQELVIQNKDLVNRLEKFENLISSHNINVIHK
jgi:hypothetical protein